MSGGLITLFVFGGFFALIYFLRRREAVSVRNGFVLAGSPDARVKGVIIGDQVVVGTLGGRPFRCEVHQGGKNSPGFTIVETPIPDGAPPFEMHLRPQGTGDARLMQRGLEIDVMIGDPIFDPQVVVEAAPQDLARALLDSGLQQAVLTAMPCHLSIADGVVRMRVRPKISDPMRVSNMLMLVARTAARLLEADAALAQRRLAEAQQAGQAYRGMDAEAVRAAMQDPTARSMNELAELRRVRTSRQNRVRLIFGGFAVVSVGIMILFQMIAMKGSSSSHSTHSTTPASTSPNGKSTTTSKSGANAASKMAYPAGDASAAAAAKRAVAAAHDASGPAPATSSSSKPPLVPKLGDAELTLETFCALQAGIQGIARRTLCSTGEQGHAATRKSIAESDQDVDNCAGALTASLERQHISFSATAARACVKTTYDLFNAGGTKDYERVAKSRDGACKGVLSGKLASADACTADFECQEGLACQGPTSNRRCRGPGKSGDRCGAEIDLLGAGTEPPRFNPDFGENHLHDACGAGLMCGFFDDVCQPLAAEGATCDAVSSVCADDLFCILGKCSRGPRHEIGGACHADLGDDCAPGLTCDKKTTTCVPIKLLEHLCE